MISCFCLVANFSPFVSCTLSYFWYLSHIFFFFLMIPPPPTSTLFPYTTLFRSGQRASFRSENYGSGVMAAWSATREEQLPRSEEHTSELQSHSDLVCRLLLEKKKEQV